MQVSDRLTAVLLKSGAATPEEIASGKWAGGKCPFTFRDVPGGGKQIDIDKGEVLMRAIAPTLKDAVAKLEAKVGIEPETDTKAEGGVA
jgi:hypothetical protein